MTEPVSGNHNPLYEPSLKAAKSLTAFARPFLIKAGAQYVVVAYEGSNDEGAISGIQITPEVTLDLDGIRINFHAGVLGLRTHSGNITQPLPVILDWMFMYYVYADFPAFETGRGGAGTVTWDVSENTIRVEHTRFFIDRATETREH